MQFRNDWEYYVNRSARWVDFENDYRTMDLSLHGERHVGVQRALGQRPHLRRLPRRPLLLGGADAALEFRDPARQRIPHAPGPGADRRLPAPPTAGEAAAPKLLAWTTTPWTLPSNLALAVHPEADYALMEGNGEHWILADSSREHYARELDGFTKVGTLKGAELSAAPTSRCSRSLPSTANSFVVVRRRLHRAGRGHRRRPYRARLRRGRHERRAADGMPVVDPVDFAGNFTDDVAALRRARMSSRPTRTSSAISRRREVVVRHETYEHNYPHCWRTDQPLIYKAIPSWYVKVTAVQRRAWSS